MPRRLRMSHPYPRLCPTFDYRGRVNYFITFKTHERQPRFRRSEIVEEVLTQFQRAATEEAFAILLHCFMPDHAHLIISGQSETSDAKAFLKASKQYSGFYVAKRLGHQRLWQRYCHDRIIRDDVELLDRVRYVVNNPVAAGIVERAEQYPFWGSSRWTREELLGICRRGFPNPTTGRVGRNL